MRKLECVFRNRSGEIGLAILSSEQIELDGERYSVAFAQDITERKRAEQALRQSEARFSAVFHTNPVRISMSRVKDGHYVDINEAHVVMFGYSREDLLSGASRSNKIWVDSEQRSAYEQMREQHGGVRQFEF